MVHNNSSSEPASIQGGLQNKTASKKTSTYILDSNGDTQLILSTYKDQPFIWEAETIWIGRERSTKKYFKKKKRAERNADSSTLRIQDWDYGERSGILPNKVEIRMLVSGKHLELASSYFEKMFSGPFTEAKADHSGLRRVTATDWDPEAFNIMLTIIHGYHRDIPRSLDLEMLAKLAMIVDYYECHEIIKLHADI